MAGGGDGAGEVDWSVVDRQPAGWRGEGRVSQVQGRLSTGTHSVSVCVAEDGEDFTRAADFLRSMDTF